MNREEDLKSYINYFLKLKNVPFYVYQVDIRPCAYDFSYQVACILYDKDGNLSRHDLNISGQQFAIWKTEASLIVMIASYISDQFNNEGNDILKDLICSK